MGVSRRRKGPRIGVPRTPRGLAEALLELDRRTRSSPEDPDLHRLVQSIPRLKGLWAGLDKLLANNLAEAMLIARRNIESVLRTLTDELRTDSSPQAWGPYVEARLGQERFEDQLGSAAYALATATTISRARPKFLDTHPGLWALDRIQAAVRRKEVTRCFITPQEGWTGPRAAALEVVAFVLGRTASGVAKYIERTTAKDKPPSLGLSG